MGELKNVLVVGDVMIDKYTYVMSDRQAPEAPIPVWDEVSSEKRLGGAANVAHNLKCLGKDEIEVALAGIVSTEDKKMILKAGISTYLCTSNDAKSMVKHRIVKQDEQKIITRIDNKKRFSDADIEAFKSNLKQFLPGAFPAGDFDVIVISDYDKGTINEDVIEILKNYSNVFIVDSKRTDLSMFRGMQVLKINEHEYANQVSHGPYTNVESLFDYVVVTKGAKGSTLLQNEVTKSTNNRYVVHSEDFPVEPVKAKDVTGCGDTHTAAMTFSLLKNGDVRFAVKFANACARNVVQKFGTSTCE